MAEEEAPQEGGEAAGKKSKVMVIGLIIGLLLVLGGGGYFAYTKFIKKPPTEEGAEEAPPAKEGEAAHGEKGDKEKEKKEAKKVDVTEPGLGVMVPLEPFIVNLSDSQGKRFLKVAVTLELNTPEVHAEVNENIQKITDSILILLSSKTFEDIYSVQGKFKLKDEITTRVNRFLVLGHVKDAYFTEFVIQ